MNKDLKVDIIGDYLKDKNIALCVSGGIAAIETPKIARHLRRYGADVKAYFTNEAEKFIGKACLEWATEQEVVSELSGKSEHIQEYDLVLVCPATLNTVNKIFYGIADNPVTCLVASALGFKTPVYLVPTMHESLFNNPIFLENLDDAEIYGIKVIEPRVSEGKKKMPKLETIVANVSRELSEHPIKGKKILITGGPTPVKIDSIRRITNIFKGKLAVEIASDAYMKGADVKLLIGDTEIKVPAYLDVLRHKDLDEYIENVFDSLEKGYDAGVFSAAVADYQPVEVKEGKIASNGGLKELQFKETIKVINKVRAEFPELFMVTFKYECGVSREQLETIAQGRLSEGYQMVVANRDEDMKDKHTAYIYASDLKSTVHTKKGIAKGIVDIMGLKV